jgi:hypothetical protein
MDKQKTQLALREIEAARKWLIGMVNATMDDMRSRV